jgi:hypothetical protein
MILPLIPKTTGLASGGRIDFLFLMNNKMMKILLGSKT